VRAHITPRLLEGQILFTCILPCMDTPCRIESGGTGADPTLWYISRHAGSCERPRIPFIGSGQCPSTQQSKRCQLYLITLSNIHTYNPSTHKAICVAKHLNVSKAVALVNTTQGHSYCLTKNREPKTIPSLRICMCDRISDNRTQVTAPDTLYIQEWTT